MHLLFLLTSDISKRLLLFSLSILPVSLQTPLLLGWLLSLSVVATAVYATYTQTGREGEQWSVLQSAMYQAFSRPLWASAVSFIIFACTVGQGGEGREREGGGEREGGRGSGGQCCSRLCTRPSSGPSGPPPSPSSSSPAPSAS